MAKTKGSLWSIHARGSIGKAISFEQRRVGGVVRKYAKPSGLPSDKQAVIRVYVSDGVGMWKTIKDYVGMFWDMFVDKNGNVGYHSFMSAFMERVIANLNPYYLPRARFTWKWNNDLWDMWLWDFVGPVAFLLKWYDSTWDECVWSFD